jgi:hypothetical protein
LRPPDRFVIIPPAGPSIQLANNTTLFRTLSLTSVPLGQQNYIANAVWTLPWNGAPAVSGFVSTTKSFTISP